MACPSYSIVATPHTHDPPTYIKLEWLVHCILSFTLHTDAMLRRIYQLPTSVGLTQAHPNKWFDPAFKSAWHLFRPWHLFPSINL